jgi:hypothetical protein
MAGARREIGLREWRQLQTVTLGSCDGGFAHASLISLDVAETLSVREWWVRAMVKGGCSG